MTAIVGRVWQRDTGDRTHDGGQAVGLRDGLKNLRTSQEEDKEAALNEQIEAAAPPGVDKPADETRETYSTRIRRGLDQSHCARSTLPGRRCIRGNR